MKEQKYILKNCNTFKLKDIFDCGQCFRWNENEDGSYKNFLCSSTLWKNELELHNVTNKVEMINVEPNVKKEEVLEPTDNSNKETKEEVKDESIDYYEKIRKELEETRKALSNEFMNLDTDDELVSFEDVGRGL